MFGADTISQEQESAQLSDIWDQLYSLYLRQANGDGGPGITAEINRLIRQRDAIRGSGWSSSRQLGDGQDVFKPTR